MTRVFRFRFWLFHYLFNFLLRFWFFFRLFSFFFIISSK